VREYKGTVDLACFAEVTVSNICVGIGDFVYVLYDLDSVHNTMSEEQIKVILLHTKTALSTHVFYFSTDTYSYHDPMLGAKFLLGNKQSQ
jgi:hypothetical protein